MTPIALLNEWINQEKTSGAKYTQHAVLSTSGAAGEGHGRVVAVRLIDEEGLLFFTQQRTRKVAEIKRCNKVSLIFWFEREAREVIVEGEAAFLSHDENEQYWNSYPQWAQVRFSSYAPTSGLPIANKQQLEEKRRELQEQHQDTPLPLSPDYCGIRIRPERFVFYSYRLDELSDVWEYQIEKQGFTYKILSP